ncbi:hypothetical protein COW36_12865 [bacterium (Candidatus Blackallbacteria) CG17_big_fil_post_rev_8_21_14_2_50_48_46]|uniref:Uncharacterized protein n=1 Tax=bacterium (Candidatus Blackallbacteria) CG17_big_fil_post_rev_8_21_14_2_50_48_46 TaxID=2014261 RepID=A0A2M7G468_9BACT|nr:MAG: hypothetical protein COW64_02400 [bacterium (Candidatus Blackallbacteria) CG18_big_fil_WC_8_21_14_2_50_49_26]PIW16650.1 MAG: hypothetical protein COW36_12865 [bacterium (Candidatus Blackallbacteria) CG17_big_fil_post_rev_8_21_14_2_50_48_46]PIW46156.1 MAG: hypothetical protein COW20_18120 [bacterium (Candidatus Blackallbacteria) CG13_big_fil_rev_8_21_14_2_50_49_14]
MRCAQNLIRTSVQASGKNFREGAPERNCYKNVTKIQQIIFVLDDFRLFIKFLKMISFPQNLCPF